MKSRSLHAKSAFTNAEAAALAATDLYTPTNRPHRHTALKKGIAALLVTVAIGIAILVSNFLSLLGYHVQELFTRVANVQHTSHSVRRTKLANHMLKNQGTKHTTLPKKFKTRLKKQGIDYGFIDSAGDFISGTAPKGTPYVLKYKDQIITDFSTTTKSNPLFINSANRAARTKVSDFFDTPANRYYNQRQITRNDLANFRQTGNSDADDIAFSKIIGRKLGDNSDIRLGVGEDIDSKDQNGRPIKQRTDGGSISSDNITGSDPTTRAKAYLDDISSKTRAGSAACTGLKVGQLVSSSIYALETFHAINFFMGFSESISKAKAGFGHQSGINSTLNFLNKSTTTTITDAATSKPLKITGSPLDSPGMRSILHGIPPDKSLAKNFSLERGNHIAKTIPALSEGSVAACSGVNTGAAVLSLGTLLVPGGTFLKITATFLKTAIFNTGIALTFSLALSALIPTIAEVMFSNRLETATGQTGGELFTKGAVASGGQLARSGSGYSPSSASAALAFDNTTRSVLAAEDRIARATANPFDLTTSSSFFGSLAFSLASTFSPKNTPITTLSLSSHALTSALLPNTYASTKSYMTTFGDCPTLESVGIKGDIYCNPITTSDTTTLDIAPDDPTYRSIIEKNLIIDPSTGKETIKPNSSLAQKIMLCDERQSPFGVIDPNIQNALQTSFGVVGDNLPILNDIVDILNAAEDAASLPWATGKICVNSSDNPRWNSEFKYYQRYVEDSRLLSQLTGDNNDNPVVALKDAYELAHPTDHSPAGTFARLAGITKYDAEGILALASYQSFLTSYHPASRHQFAPTGSAEPLHLSPKNTPLPAGSALLLFLANHSHAKTSTLPSDPVASIILQKSLFESTSNKQGITA